MTLKVISGGQIGADIAGLRFAKELGLETGGWMTKNWKTIHGPKPEYEIMYNMRTVASDNYAERTSANVLEADVTLRFATDFFTKGEKCTANAITRFGKPHLDIPFNGFYDAMINPTYLGRWLLVQQPRIINIAGNAKVELEEPVIKFLEDAFQLVNYDS